jgi:hypothetical protein
MRVVIRLRISQVDVSEAIAIDWLGRASGRFLAYQIGLGDANTTYRPSALIDGDTP